MAADTFYWCLTHKRVENSDDRCKADNRLGPYPTVDAAQNWREKVEDRNDTWEDQDEAWNADERPDRSDPA